MWLLARGLNYVAIAALLHSMATCANAQDDRAAVTDLVVGDGYTIRVERNGVTETIAGDLVKATANWIVLERQQGEQTEYAVPISKLPYFSRTFKNVGVGREHDVVWLPREAATIEQRSMSAEQPPLTEIDGDEPPSGQLCHVQYVAGAEAKSVSGKLSNDEGTDLTVSSEVMVEERQGVPMLSEIPLVGRAFTRTTRIAQHRSHKLARANVLAVRVDIE